MAKTAKKRTVTIDLEKAVAKIDVVITATFRGSDIFVGDVDECIERALETLCEQGHATVTSKTLTAEITEG